MFKNLIALIFVGLLFSGCATIGGNTSINPDVQNAAILTTIEVAGYELGYFVGKSKTDADDIAIADAYKLAREGKLSPAELAQAFSKFKIERPELSGAMVIVLKNMGATFDANTGDLLTLTGIPVIYWDKAAEGYAVGYEFGKMGQKSINKSAIVKYIPKKK